MTDRGLRSRNLWEKMRSLGWRPYMRQRINTTFRLDVGVRMPARRPVAGPGNSFIGSGTAFSASSKRLRGTIIVVHAKGHGEPWAILIDIETCGGRSVVAQTSFLDRNGIQRR